MVYFALIRRLKNLLTMQIQEIKNHLSITKILNHYGIKPDRNKRINCPFHADKTPSMQVYENTNTVYCFSSNCKTHGHSLDVIDFIMHKEGLDKHTAILKAKQLIGNSPQQSKQSENPKHIAQDLKPETNLERIAVLTKMYSYFKKAVYNSQPAKEYLQQRNIDYQNTEVGYNSGQFHHGSRKDKYLIESCLKYGLLIDQGNKSRTGDIAYTVFGKLGIVFPLRNQENKIVSLYFRSTKNNKTQKHFYLKNRQGLYPKYPNPQSKKIILTESIIDAASLLQQPEIKENYEVLALYGTNGLSDEHLKAIKELKQLQEIILFFDGDAAGEKAAEKYANELCKDNTYIVSKVETPENEDINSLLQGHEAEILSHLLENRKLLFSNETSIENKSNEQNKKPFILNNQPNLKNKLPFEEATEPNKENPIPKLSQSQIPTLITKNPELLLYKTEDLKITVLGGIRISGLDRLKVTLKIEKILSSSSTSTLTSVSTSIIRHSLDLYHAKQTDQLTEMINNQMELSSTKSRQIIANLTTELENYRQKRLEALKPKVKETYRMSEAEKIEAINYLKNPKLMQQTLKDIETSGVIGEQSNAMTGFIVNLSRKREKPLHVMYLGASGSGKTHLQESLSALIPEEDRIEATGLSDQSLYYEGLKLKGKILFIEDLDGAENVIYIIRELQSKGKISKRVAWRDNKGNTKTIEIIAEGPVVISSCTTKEKLYEDNANRCILLYIDQSKSQDKKIMDYMKALSTGKIKTEDQKQIKSKMQNVQRMLRPVKVYNPYAHLIDLPPEVFKPRRSLPLLLGFIETLTFYHQYQRRRITTDKNGNPTEPYILSSIEDVEQSFNLMKEVLFSKSDELSKASRDFLERLKKEVKPGETFYTKEIRKKFRIPYASLKRYVSELQSNGYLKVKGGNRYRGYEYKIADYGEYSSLRQSIEKRLNDILLKIKNMSSSVAQSGSLSEMSHLTNGLSNK